VNVRIDANDPVRVGDLVGQLAFAPYPTISVGELEAADPTQLWLVEGLVPARGLTLLVGEPKGFKTLLAQQLALAVASEQDEFLQFRTAHGAVVFVEEEGSAENLRSRFQAIAAGATIPDRLRVVHRQSVRLDPASLVRLEGSCLKWAATLLVLDPFAFLHDKDENQAGEMGDLMRSLSALAVRARVSVVVIHHIGKPRLDNRTFRSDLRPRGSSAIAAAADAIIAVDRAADNLRLTATLRDGPLGTLRLSFDRETLSLVESSDERASASKGTRDLLEVIRDRGELTAPDAGRALGVATNTARKRLDAAVTAGVLATRLGQKNAILYRLPGQAADQ
jgi:hypothetical protein